MNLAKHQPPSLSGILERERLLAKLASWSDRKLVIVHGQAGQGKSTLAADFIRAQHTPSLWYSLDAGDDDPHLFFTSLEETVRRIHPRQAKAALPVPRDRYCGKNLSPAIAPWFGRIFRETPSILIVFDDFHVLAGSVTLPAILTMLIESTPASVRVMILSRTKPELPLDRLRAKRAVGELTAADLKFTDSEVSDLFDSVFGYPLSKEQAAHICRMTEGWPVGLVLMHEYLSENGPAKTDSLLGQRLPEFRNQVFDYLAAEVFSQLDPPLKEFLLRTAVADSIPLPLASLLTGLPGGPAQGHPSVAGMVAELVRRGLFTDSGGEKNIVRYHALFREFLVKQLAARLRPSEVRGLYRTAAGFFIRNRTPARAADLLIESGQFEQAANLLERTCRDFIARGQIRTVLRLIDRLPQPIRQRPWFLFVRAMACRFTDPQTALLLADEALAGFRAEKNTAAQMLTLGCVIEAAFHSGGDFKRMKRAIVQAQSLLRHRGRESRQARPTLLLALGTAWFFTGRLQQGIDALRTATDLFRAAGDHFSQISCAIYLAPCALYRGDFQAARDAVRRGFEAQRAAPDEPDGEAALYLVQAMTHLFTGDFAAAQDALDAGRRLAGEYRIESIDLLLLDIYGWLRIAQGDYCGAERLLDECRQRGEASSKAFFNLSASHFLAIASLFQRKLERAKQLSDHALAPGARADSALFHAIYMITSGAIHRELGDFPRAERELHASLRMLRRSGAAQQEANCHLVLAGLYLKQNKTSPARRHLKLGFSIGRERGFTYYAPLAPRELHDLAQEAMGSGICADYCATLLDRRRPAAAAPLLRIHCLGGFRVERNGEPIRERDWKGRQAKRLIKLLAARDGKPLSRDAVIEAIWPDGDTERYTSVLGSLLHRVRKALDRGSTSNPHSTCVRFEEEHLFLNRSLVWTDIEAFLAAVGEVFRTDRPQDDERSLRHCDQAIALYQGELLPEDVYEDWTVPVRDDLRARYLKLLERAGELADKRDDAQRATIYYERLFDADQCSEKACCWLMTRALAGGRRSDAIRIYERCQLALRKELDLEPDERTRRLYRSIIGG